MSNTERWVDFAAGLDCAGKVLVGAGVSEGQILEKCVNQESKLLSCADGLGDLHELRKVGSREAKGKRHAR